MDLKSASDWPKRFSTGAVMALIGILAILHKESHFAIFIALCAGIVTISIFEAINLFRKASNRVQELKGPTASQMLPLVIAATLLSVFYIIVLDPIAIALLAVVTFGYDIFALAFGRFLKDKFFKERPFPDIWRKKKTFEGVIGGIASSAILGTTYILVFTPILKGISVSDFPNILIIAGGGFAAMFGDLANSYFKRLAAADDSGWIFPGHGGCLDRFMSLYSVTILYLFLNLPLFFHNFG